MNRPRTPLELFKVAASDVPAYHRLGGATRVLLEQSSALTSAGFMALLDLEPGECVTEHYHPYSDEHVYIANGEIVALVNDDEVVLNAREAVLIRRGSRHRYENRGDRPATAVLFLGPLAPRADLGHVETERAPRPQAAPPRVGDAP
ncbi:cupin domain-containing protein [Actinomadura viridis]|uniref:Monooxygenase n=1 Tax=Actinomadura viridis TaxID=58110 RepID=A0A931DTH7_9ACTN|nr:cupin domain-containing protein [Actinomadura viridis]MBG6093627.1 putative monooxygenase [Actinomadura viridis]